MQENMTSIDATLPYKEKSITDAFFGLIARKPFKKVSISEVCEEAGVARNTLYRNFGTLEAILEKKLDGIISALDLYTDMPVRSPRAAYAFCFKSIEADRNFAAAFLDPDLNGVILKKLKGYLERAYNDILHSAVSFEPMFSDYYTTFIADGIISIVRSWIKDGFKCPADIIAKLAEKLLSGVMA